MAAVLKIDAHQHFWQFDPQRDSWITDEMSILQSDYLPAELGEIYQEYAIDGCVAVQASQSLAENDFLLDLAGKNDFIKGVIGWVDLQHERVEDQLAQYAESKKMKGFRHVLQGESNRALMLEPAFKRGISYLEKYGFSYDLLIFPDQLSFASELAAAFPKQRFVLDHIAKPDIKGKTIENWKRDITLLAEYENVHCKISGLVTEADWKSWHRDDFSPYLDVVFEAFGINRLMYGSDWPVCNLAGGYKGVVDIVENYLDQLSENEKTLFWGQNAIKFYQL